MSSIPIPFPPKGKAGLDAFAGSALLHPERGGRRADEGPTKRKRHPRLRGTRTLDLRLLYELWYCEWNSS